MALTPAVETRFPLDASIYQMNEAARFLALPEKTLRRWIDGDRRFGRRIEPLIRPASTGVTDVTWGEFIEAGLLAEYRNRRLPLTKLRPLIADLREGLGTPYPLAVGQPLYAEGGELLWRLQEKSGLDESLFLVVNASSEGYQLALSDMAERFASRVEFRSYGEGTAIRWYPGTRGNRRIVIDPTVRFGLPSIAGIRTEVIAEFATAGETLTTISNYYTRYGLTRVDIEEAICFERRLRGPTT